MSKGKEETVVILDFSLTKMTIVDGVVTKKERLCDVGGAFTVDKVDEIQKELVKAMGLIK